MYVTLQKPNSDQATVWIGSIVVLQDFGFYRILVERHLLHIYTEYIVLMIKEGSTKIVKTPVAGILVLGQEYIELKT